MSLDELVAVLAYLVMACTMTAGAIEMWGAKTLAGRFWLSTTLLLLAFFFLFLAVGLIVLRYHQPMPIFRTMNRYIVGASAMSSAVFLVRRYGKRREAGPV